MQIFLQWGVHEVSTSAFCNHRGGRIISMTLFPSLYNSWGQNIIQAIPSQFGIFSVGCISYSGLLIDCFNIIDDFYDFNCCHKTFFILFSIVFSKRIYIWLNFRLFAIILRNLTSEFWPKTGHDSESHKLRQGITIAQKRGQLWSKHT